VIIHYFLNLKFNKFKIEPNSKIKKLKIKMDDDDMWKIIDKIDNRKVRKNK